MFLLGLLGLIIIIFKVKLYENIDASSDFSNSSVETEESSSEDEITDYPQLI